MKVLTFSRQFPKKHPRAGEPTYFVDKIATAIMCGDEKSVLVGEYWNTNEVAIVAAKYHTIRNGNRWEVGEKASLRFWADKPYRSKQIEFAQVELKKVWSIKIERVSGNVTIKDGKRTFFTNIDSNRFSRVAAFDGFDSKKDLVRWIKCYAKKKGKYIFKGQILCWFDKINY